MNRSGSPRSHSQSTLADLLGPHALRAWAFAVVLAWSGIMGCTGTRQGPTGGGRESVLSADDLLVYFGTYTRGDSKSEGVYIYAFDVASGSLNQLGVAAVDDSPSFVAIHPTGQYLYAVNEIAEFEGKKSGTVSSFSIDSGTGMLTFLNRQLSGGSGPCHLVVDGSGRSVLVANYGGGSVAALPIREDGSLGDATSFIQHEGSSITPRQRGPHAHSINVDNSNRMVAVADLGLDQVLLYRFDSEIGRMTRNHPAFVALEPGAGPRHFAFHPNGTNAYVINELDSTVTVFSYDQIAGSLTPRQTVVTLPPDFVGENSTAEIQVHPSGRFVYGSNRGHDSIVVFRVVPATGELIRVENEPTLGATPRNFGIDPSGRFLLAANQGSDSVVVFRIDETSGELTPTGERASLPSPVCVKFLDRSTVPAKR